MKAWNLFRASGIGSRIGSVLIIVAFGIVAFCGVAALVIDMSRVYLEVARFQEATEAAGMAASQEMAKFVHDLSAVATNEAQIKQAAINFAKQNGITMTSSDIAIAGERIYINCTKEIEYTFAKIIGFNSQSVSAKSVIKLGPNGKPAVIQQARYNVMPFGMPHKIVSEPYDVSNKIVTLTPAGNLTQVEKFTPGQEYVIKLGTGQPLNTASVPPGSQVLIPMGTELGVNDQWNIGFYRAYGLALWLAGRGVPVKWLLGYRGGSFMFTFDEVLMRELGAFKMSGFGEFGDFGMFIAPDKFQWVKYRVVTDATTIYGQAQAVINITKYPRIAIYSSYYDAVAMVLSFAGINFTTIYDNDILTGALSNIDWLFMSHENFLGGSNVVGVTPQIEAFDTTDPVSSGAYGSVVYVKSLGGFYDPEMGLPLNNIKFFFDEQQMHVVKTVQYGCTVAPDGMTVNPNAEGSFEVYFSVPPRPNGTYKIYAQCGDEISNLVSYTVTDSTIVPAISAVNHAAGGFMVTRSDKIRVTGSNFGGNQPGIIVKYNNIGQNIAKTATYPNCQVSDNSFITADENGFFEVTFDVPEYFAEGTYEVSAQVDTAVSNKVNIAIVSSFISISDGVGVVNKGPAGSVVDVSGICFPANQTNIRIFFNSQTMNLTDSGILADDVVYFDNVTANPSGSFNVRFTVPDIANGTYEVKAATPDFNSNICSYTVMTASTAEVNIIGSNTGNTGTRVVVAGAYFPSSSSGYRLKMGDNFITALIDRATYPDDSIAADGSTFGVNADGSFEFEFVVPAGLSVGPYTIRAYLNDLPASTETTYNVIANPVLVITDTAAPNDSGPCNELITVSGSGFPSNTADIKIYFNGQAMTGVALPAGYVGSATVSGSESITTDGTGSFQITFHAPYLLTPINCNIKASNGSISTPDYPYALGVISNNKTSLNSGFTTTDDNFSTTEKMYLRLFATNVDHSRIANHYFTIECLSHSGAARHTTENILLNYVGDFTYTSEFDWAGYAAAHNGDWQINYFLSDTNGSSANASAIVHITQPFVVSESTMICAAPSGETPESYAFAYNNTRVKFKVITNFPDTNNIAECWLKLSCGSGHHDFGQVNLTRGTDVSGAYDQTYYKEINISTANGGSPPTHLGLWKAEFKVKDNLATPRTTDIIREFYLMPDGGTTDPRIIVSRNQYYSEPPTYSTMPIFNKNGTIYILFCAKPPNATTPNCSNPTLKRYVVRFSTNSNMKNPVSTRYYDLTPVNGMPGLFNASIVLNTLTTTAGSPLPSSNEKYFTVTAEVSDGTNTATRTSAVMNIDHNNTQTNFGVASNDAPSLYDAAGFMTAAGVSFRSAAAAAAHAFKTASSGVSSASSYGIERFRRFECESRMTAFDRIPFRFRDEGLLRDMIILSAPGGLAKYMKTYPNNLLANCPPADNAVKNDSGLLANARTRLFGSARPKRGSAAAKSPDALSEYMKGLVMPGEAHAVAYAGKYNVVQTIRTWVTQGGYLFGMCYATETIDNVLDMNEQGQQLANYNNTFVFTGFTPGFPNPVDGLTAIDTAIFTGNFCLVSQNPNADPFKRNLMSVQNHVTTLPNFSGATSSYRRAFVKTRTGPSNSQVFTFGEIQNVPESVKYIGGSYGYGWYTFLSGHDPRTIEVYRLILNHAIIGSISPTAQLASTAWSYGALDWDSQDAGYDAEKASFSSLMKFGRSPSMAGDVVTTYPGDLMETTVVTQPYCFEDVTMTAVSYLYATDPATPPVGGHALPRNYTHYEDGSSRFVLVPLVTPYYSNGTRVYSQPNNIAANPQTIYQVIGRDRVRIKGYALFFLSDVNPHGGDALMREVGSTKLGEVRGKFVGYLK